MKNSNSKKANLSKKYNSNIKSTSTSQQESTDEDNLKGLYDLLESKGTPKTMSNLIYLSDGLYMTEDGDLVEE